MQKCAVFLESGLFLRIEGGFCRIFARLGIECQIFVLYLQKFLSH